jgi:hypothetical protein
MRFVLVCFEINELSVYISIPVHFLQLSRLVRHKYMTSLVIMAGPSTRCALTELEQGQILNEVLEDESVGEFSSDSGSIFDSNYTQLLTPVTHVMV